MTRTSLFITTLIFSLFTIRAHAYVDASANSIRAFGQYVSYLQVAAPQALHLGPLDGGIIYLRNESRLEFSNQALGNLTSIAGHLAARWGDTVLHSEIRTQGPLAVESVEGLYSGQTLIGYRMTYGQTAFDLDSCQAAAIASCHLGDLRESAFVTPDFRHVEIDQAAQARLQF